MKRFSFYSIFMFTVSMIMGFNHETNQNDPWTKSKLLFEDNGTGNWKEKWILDGQRARVINSDDGMELMAGPKFYNDTCHAVLWTKQVFEGNICIEFDYTRTDTATRFVNILYFLATGEGSEEYPEDITLWNDKRAVPAMSKYYNYMNTYHISFAAFSAKKYSGDNDYVRLRRYDPSKEGLNGTMVPGEYFKTGLFKPNVTYHIQVFRYNDQIEMHVQNREVGSKKTIYQWDASIFPACESGRIGLRHMYTRSARYKDFKVWKIE